MILRSRIVVPVARAPIENGAVCISGNRIVAAGTWEEIKGQYSDEVVDLGESLLLPGFVNAHCHLDYTNMAGMISPTRHFVDWVKAMLALKAEWGYSEYAESWLRGAQMLLRTGTTTVADIEAVPELLPEVWSTTPLRVRSFLELTCVRSGRRAADIVREAVEWISGLPSDCQAALLSPHALYSTNAELMEMVAGLTREKGWPVTVHVAESEAESEMFQFRKGAFYDLLKNQREMSDCGGLSPIQQLEKCGMLSPQFLAVHVNYLASGDAYLLAKNGCSVAHCPRSHAYFCHHEFPFEELSQAGINVCLGTDSLATTIVSRRQPPELNMFAEMRRFSDVRIQVPPATILRMATMNGAKALGLSGEVGELSVGARADVISIPFAGKTSLSEETVINHSGHITAAMIDGRWAIR